MSDDNFIYKLVGDSSSGGQYGLADQTSVMDEDTVNGLVAQQLRTLTERQVMVSGSSQSQNFKSGVSGWQIDGFGNAEFNDGTFRGTFILGGVLITINDITKLQAAITTVSTAGGGIVSLEPGTYNATSSFTIPSGVTLEGNGATIDFGGGAYQILIQGTNAYSTGTVTATYGSAAVTGSGTTWTAGMVGQSILLGDFWYTIASRASNTSITLSSNFMGTNLSGDTYVIATTVDGAGLSNITLNNASGTLLKFRYVNGLQMDGIVCSNGGQGIDGDDSATINWLNSTVSYCTAGITYDNVPFCTMDSVNILSISGGTALALQRVTNTAISAFSIQAVTGVGLKFTNCFDLGLINYAFIKCSSHGIEFVSGNRDVSVSEGYVDSCGGDSIKLTATSDTIQVFGNSILNSGGYGVNIAAASCDNNDITGNVFTSNSSGNINDSGTGTIIEANSPVSVNMVRGVAQGGTGLATITAHDVLVGNGTSAITPISPSTSGYVLTSNGTNSDPSFQAPSSSGLTRVGGDATEHSIQNNAAATDIVTVSGLSIAAGTKVLITGKFRKDNGNTGGGGSSYGLKINSTVVLLAGGNGQAPLTGTAASAQDGEFEYTFEVGETNYSCAIMSRYACRVTATGAAATNSGAGSSDINAVLPSATITSITVTGRSSNAETLYVKNVQVYTYATS